MSTTKQENVEVFSFGEPESVLDKGQIIDYLEAWDTGDWYEPPINLDGLSRSLRANAHHSSAIFVKRNILASTFIPSDYLNFNEFQGLALDYLVLGNGYLEKRYNRLGQLLILKRSPAKYMRVGSKNNGYVFLKSWHQQHWFDSDQICHLFDQDIDQEIYGVPEYVAALQSAWLNENATLFRRRYYKNGTHAGYIMYVTDAAHNTADVDAIREAVKSGKGAGNFKNMFMYAPNGKKDGIQIIPLSDVAAKDEFFNIKNVTRDDILAAHRVPPQLMGVMPSNVGGFGAVEPAAKVFALNELKPLQSKMLQINDLLGVEAIRFDDYKLNIKDEET